MNKLLSANKKNLNKFLITLRNFHSSSSCSNSSQSGFPCTILYPSRRSADSFKELKSVKSPSSRHVWLIQHILTHISSTPHSFTKIVLFTTSTEPEFAELRTIRNKKIENFSFDIANIWSDQRAPAKWGIQTYFGWLRIIYFMNNRISWNILTSARQCNKRILEYLRSCLNIHINQLRRS